MTLLRPVISSLKARGDYMKKAIGTATLLGAMCLALILSACSNPDSSQCSSAVVNYQVASFEASTNPAAFKLAEMDALDACGERGFLQKLAEWEEQAAKMPDE
jgi:hypothetical protein